MSAQKPTTEELHRLAQSWFKEARQQSAQDNAEVASWLKQVHDQTPRYSSYSYWSDSDSGDSCSSDGGGGGD